MIDKFKLAVFSTVAVLFVGAVTKVGITYGNKQVHQGVITEKYNKRTANTDDFFIVLDHEEVIQNTDVMFYGKFNSADIQARLKKNETVKVTTIGYRIPLLSIYPRAVKISEVQENE